MLFRSRQLRVAAGPQPAAAAEGGGGTSPGRGSWGWRRTSAGRGSWGWRRDLTRPRQLGVAVGPHPAAAAGGLVAGFSLSWRQRLLLQAHALAARSLTAPGEPQSCGPAVEGRGGRGAGVGSRKLGGTSVVT